MTFGIFQWCTEVSLCRGWSCWQVGLQWEIGFKTAFVQHCNAFMDLLWRSLCSKSAWSTFVTLHNTQMVKRLLSETLAAIFWACSSFILLFVSFQRWWEAKGTTRIRYVKFHLFLIFLEPFQWQQFFIVFQSSDKMWTGNLFCPISKWMMCSAEDGKILTYPQQSPSN